MRRFLPPLALILGLFSLSAAADTVGGVEEYRNCFAAAKRTPEQGWEKALAWQAMGGGEAARHCAAVALMGLGKYKEAATRLETLANESVREDWVRAEMLAQAAQAWMQVGDYGRADSAQRGSLILWPDNPDTLLDQAILQASLNNFQAAVPILSKVLRLQPNRIEALTLRGSAFRYVDNIPGAEDDINTALKLDPDFPDALLERGILKRLKGNDAQARADWMRVIELFPDGLVADLARQNLEKMDVKIK